MSRYDRYWKNLIFGRIKILMFISTIAFFVLIFRLYVLQIHNGEEYKHQAIKQRSTEISLNSNRGIIYDRNLNPLTNVIATKTMIGSKKTILDNKELLMEIKKNTALSVMELYQILNSNKTLIQIPLKKSVNIHGLNNIFEVDIIDRYADSNILSHVIGYINKAENKGQYGIEKTYDEFLNKSDKSSLFIEFDKKRSKILGSEYFADNTINPEEPAGVKLTVDYDIQLIIEKILDESQENGAIIVADVDTAEIRALTSRPNFNQNNMEEYFNREDMALYNKAIQVAYPPGSIFKIIVLLAALEEDLSFIERDYYCKGYEQINNLTIRCSNTNGHGHLNLKNGFAKSCNCVFMQIGKEIGSKKIIEMAKRMGLGEKINIGLLEEVGGSLPEGEELLGPAIGNISIGQGKIEVTPLQITNMLLTIANNGISKDMTIVEGITTKDGRIVKKYNKDEDKRIISKELSQIAKEYLEEVICSGTAKDIDLNQIGGAAGKTGSAEALLKGNPTIHGWFAGYYPKDNPKYVITVIVEDAELGSKSATPIFNNICKEIYRLNK